MTLPGRLSATVVLRHTHSWGLWVTLFFRCIDTSVTHTPLQQLPNTSHRHRRRRRRLLGSSSPRVPERRRTGSTQASLQASAVAAVPAFPPPRVIPWSLCTRAPRHPFDPIFRAIGVIVLSINPSLHLDSSSPCTAAPAAHCIAAAAVDRAHPSAFPHPHTPPTHPVARPLRESDTPARAFVLALCASVHPQSHPLSPLPLAGFDLAVPRRRPQSVQPKTHPPCPTPARPCRATARATA